MREYGPERNKFLLEAGYCWTCGEPTNLTCHEIARGIHREKALAERMTWLCVCWRCNSDELTDAARWPLEKQLAVKWIYDREYFHVEGVCLLRGRQPDAILFSEISPWICRILDGKRELQ